MHPNKRLFNFLKKIEGSFTSHRKEKNVFGLAVNEITQNQLEHPCSEHAEEVHAYIIHFYLENKMRQFAKISMQEAEKIHVSKKKATRLTKF